jgi:hypothetical protein
MKLGLSLLGSACAQENHCQMRALTLELTAAAAVLECAIYRINNKSVWCNSFIPYHLLQLAGWHGTPGSLLLESLNVLEWITGSLGTAAFYAVLMGKWPILHPYLLYFPMFPALHRYNSTSATLALSSWHPHIIDFSAEPRALPYRLKTYILYSFFGDVRNPLFWAALSAS